MSLCTFTFATYRNTVTTLVYVLVYLHYYNNITPPKSIDDTPQNNISDTPQNSTGDTPQNIIDDTPKKRLEIIPSYHIYFQKTTPL